MEIKLETELIRKMLKDKVINPNLPEKDQVLELFEYLLGANQRELKQLVYLLLSIDPVLNYQIGDTVRVDMEHVHSWNAGTNLKNATRNGPDMEDTMAGVISEIEPFSSTPYTVKFKYYYKNDKDEEVSKSFDQTFSEREFKDKKANAKPTLDL